MGVRGAAFACAIRHIGQNNGIWLEKEEKKKRKKSFSAGGEGFEKKKEKFIADEWLGVPS